jgi:hypothetical protein
MFAAADSLITLLIFAAIALISHWLQQRRKGQEPEAPGEKVPPPVRGPGGAPAPSRPQNWEEELRRLLQGETPASPPPAPPPTRPKPPPIPQPPRPVQPAPVTRTPATTPGTGPVAGSIQAYLEGRRLSRPVVEGFRPRAPHLDRQAAGPVRPTAGPPPTSPPKSVRKAWSPEAAQARALLQDRRSVRSAILATVILGPAKAMES